LFSHALERATANSYIPPPPDYRKATASKIESFWIYNDWTIRWGKLKDGRKKQGSKKSALKQIEVIMIFHIFASYTTQLSCSKSLLV
jgi:hypothetical protein